MNSFRRRGVWVSVIVPGLAATSLLLSSCVLEDEPGPVLRTGPGLSKSTPAPSAPAAPVQETPQPVAQEAQNKTNVSFTFVTITAPNDWVDLPVEEVGSIGSMRPIASPVDETGFPALFGEMDQLFQIEKSFEEDVQDYADVLAQTGDTNIAITEVKVPGATKARMITSDKDEYFEEFGQNIPIKYTYIIAETDKGCVITVGLAKEAQNPALQEVIKSIRVD